MFEYSTTCPLVVQEELVTGRVALVAVATGRTEEKIPMVRRRRLIFFFIICPLIPLPNQ
jgi:hypothetical protein